MPAGTEVYESARQHLTICATKIEDLVGSQSAVEPIAVVAIFIGPGVLVGTRPAHNPRCPHGHRGLFPNRFTFLTALSGSSSSPLELSLPPTWGLHITRALHPKISPKTAAKPPLNYHPQCLHDTEQQPKSRNLQLIIY